MAALAADRRSLRAHLARVCHALAENSGTNRSLRRDSCDEVSITASTPVHSAATCGQSMSTVESFGTGAATVVCSLGLPAASVLSVCFRPDRPARTLAFYTCDHQARGLAMLNASTIGGYVLEEVLAKLLADNGYDLLTSETQDPVHLRRDRHGLLVRGRGTDHQADALGDLLVPIPFSLPVRLFAEAKNRAAKTGLEAVRNAAGVVSDVNQFQPPRAGLKAWRRDSTYHYRYSLFSTSGFTAPAQDFALAHQISLIDLSGPSFSSLRREVELFAATVQALAVREGLDVLPVGQPRASLRIALGTFQGSLADADPSTHDQPTMPWPELLNFATDLAASIDDDLVLGFPVGPQVLALRPDDPQAFRQWAIRADGIVPMHLRYASGRPHGEWIVLPASEPKGRRLVLRFGTPPALAEWLFAPEATGPRRRLGDVKLGIFSTITIYQGGRPLVLQLDLNDRWASGSESREVVLSQMQDERLDGEFAWDANDEGAEAPGEWSFEAVERFVEVLKQRDSQRLDVMLFAAAHGDWIARAHVYELMRFEPQRKMSGFTKPFDWVRRKLVHERLLDPSASRPLVPRYPPRYGRALGLDLNPELGNILRKQLPWLLAEEATET